MYNVLCSCFLSVLDIVVHYHVPFIVQLFAFYAEQLFSLSCIMQLFIFLFKTLRFIIMYHVLCNCLFPVLDMEVHCHVSYMMQLFIFLCWTLRFIITYNILCGCLLSYVRHLRFIIMYHFLCSCLHRKKYKIFFTHYVKCNLRDRSAVLTQ